jgi:hypothetical protein
MDDFFTPDKGAQSKGGDFKYFVPDLVRQAPAQQAIQPGPDANPLEVDQNPQSNIQAGPATHNPANDEFKKGTGDWLLDAITAPGTFIGRLMHPQVPTKDDLHQEHLGMGPAQANLPLIDPSVGMEPGFFKGAVQNIGSLTAPSQFPLLAFTPESKAVSGLFAAMTAPQIAAKYPDYYSLTLKGETDKANQVLGEMAVLGTMGTLAAYHASGGGERLATLDKDEQAYLKGILEDHYKNEIKQEAKSGEPQLQQVPKGPTQPEGEPIAGAEHNAGDQTLSLVNAQERGTEAIRDDTGTPRGEGSPLTDTLSGTVQEGDGGEASQRELTALLPEFTKLIGGGEGGALAIEHPSGAGEGEPPPPAVISRAVDDNMAAGGVHVTRRGADISMANRAFGSLIEDARRLDEGSLLSRLFGNKGDHPLALALRQYTALGSDAIKAIMRNSMDTLKSFINGSYKLVNDAEWSGPVVDMMNHGITDPVDRPSDMSDATWAAAQHAMVMAEKERVGLRDARRLELKAMRPNLPWDSPPDNPDAPSITKFIRDDWGIKGAWYPHAHPGDWTITQLTGVDERGNNIWEPIDDKDVSWRATSMFEAHRRAAEWLVNHPGATIDVHQDTISAGAGGLTDRQRLINLQEKVKEATTAHATNEGSDNVDEILDKLLDDASAAAYGPRNSTRRQFGSTMERRTNLEGYSRDIEDFKDHLLAAERYMVLAPVRQKMMAIRNQIAKLGGLPEATGPNNLPIFNTAREYRNIIGHMDSFMEGLEGKPGLFDSSMKYALSGLGLDPNIANKVMGPVQQLWATMKLGLNPVRILSHGLQTLWAVAPILREHTIPGIAHAYDPAYDWLVHDLAIQHAGNMSDLEGFNEYKGAYFGRGTEPIDWASGGAKIARDVLISPLTLGIQFSSRVAAVGAYIKGIGEGMDALQARNYARDILDRTMGVYHPADNPALLRQLPTTMTQFKPFMAKTAQFIYGLNGPELVGFMAASALLGGVSAVGIAQLSSLVHGITGGESIADNLKRKYPQLSRGVFGAMGVDVPSAVGPSDFSPYRKDAPFGGLAGPFWSDMMSLAKAEQEHIANPISKQAEDDMQAALRGLSPQGRRIWDEAIRGTSTNPSLIDPRTGATIIKSLTPLERLEAVAGFTPLRVAEERESHEYIRNQLQQAKDRRGFFVDKLAENQLELMRPNLTASQKADLVKETIDLQKLAVEYNQAHNLIPAVRDRIKGMMQERLERDFRKAPKVERPMIQQEMQRYKEAQ